MTLASLVLVIIRDIRVQPYRLKRPFNRAAVALWLFRNGHSARCTQSRLLRDDLAIGFTDDVVRRNAVFGGSQSFQKLDALQHASQTRQNMQVSP